MDFQVIFKASFIAYLEPQLRSIAHDNPAAASNLGHLIVKTAESLRFFPERHPRVRQRPQIRRFIIKKHFKIFYRVLPESRTVEVLRCWDGRREHDPKL
jgi:plasmid stabilization system protein ParE